MADTSVAITAGTGTAIDTRTEATNGNHRQVIVIGDPATNAGVAPVDATNGLAVQIIPALPAGSNAIGKLAANSGVDIGDVDVTTVIPGTGATQLGKAADAVAGATDTGVSILAIRDDSLTTLTPADGDYAPLRVNSTGALHVTGGGGGTEYTEDVAAAADPSGQILMAVRRDTLSASEVSADGDNIALKATSKGHLHVFAEISTVGQLAAGQAAMALSNPVAIASDQSAIPMVGSIAHDSPDGGFPVKQGFKATSSLSALTPVTTADRTDAFAGTDGVQIVRPDTNLEDISVQAISCTSGANTSALAAAGASIKWYVKGVIIFNNGASNGSLLLTDGSGGTTKAKVPFPASTGTVVTFPLPIAFTANTAVFADPSGSDTIDVTIFGFKSKV